MGMLDTLRATDESVTETLDIETAVTNASVAGPTAGGGTALAFLAAQVLVDEQIADYLEEVAHERVQTSLDTFAAQRGDKEASKLWLGQACVGVCKLFDPIFEQEGVEQLAYQNPGELSKLIEQQLSGDGLDHEQLREVETTSSVLLLGDDPPEDIELDFDPDDEQELKMTLMDLFNINDTRKAIQLLARYEQFLTNVVEAFTAQVDGKDLSSESHELLEQLNTDVEKMHGRVDEFIDMYLRLGVRHQGFRQLTVRDFQLRNSFGDLDKSPLEAWKGGFTFPELADETKDGNGHYFERALTDDCDLWFKTDDAETISDAVVERLYDSQNMVLLGESGMGKSHICQLAATKWVDRQYGEVFYRKTAKEGQGKFEDHAELKESIRQVQNTRERHVLVVVEDATRDHARLIFEVMKEFRVMSNLDVSFLLDSRTHEWAQYTNRYRDRKSPPYGFLDEDNNYLEEYDVPPVCRRDCGNAISVFNKTTGGYYPHSPDQLYETVSSVVNGRAELLVLIDALVRQGSVDEKPPIADDAATVHENLWHLIDIDDEADRLYYEVVVGSMLLSAAEIGVQSSLLYALADGKRDPQYIDKLLNGTSAESQRRSEPVPYELPETFVFPSNSGTEYWRSRHPLWATSFLAYHINGDEINRDFHDIVIDVIEKMAGGADNPQKRNVIIDQLESQGTDPAYFETFEMKPVEAASALLTELYQLATQNEQLQPLTGARESAGGWGKSTVFDSGIAVEAVPDACPDQLSYELLLGYADTLADWDSTTAEKRRKREFLKEFSKQVDEELEQPNHITVQIQRRLADVTKDRSEEN